MMGKRILRIFGLMLFADRVRFVYMRFSNRKINRDFKKMNPDVILPPDYLMYESFQLDYYRYYVNGRKTAEWLIDLIKPHINFSNAEILDWGCGPGRIIRHLPDLVPDAKSYFGTDYNTKTISWCQSNLKSITFAKNELFPPLPFDNDSVDLIYAISIFTHLSESAHDDWLNELHRVLRPNGVLFLTLHGDGFQVKLEPAEQNVFKQNKLVVRGQVKEGHRTFIAFHPPEFVKSWASQFEVLKHVPGKSESGAIEQDVWIFKKS